MSSWGRVVGSAAVVALIAMGCGGRQESSSRENTTRSRPELGMDTKAGPGMGATETPSWLTELHGHEADLRSAIESDRLQEVRRHTEALQATLHRAGQEATGLSANQRTMLDQLLTDESAIADDLQAAGDARDLARTKTEFARLSASLRAIEGQLGVGAS